MDRNISVSIVCKTHSDVLFVGVVCSDTGTLTKNSTKNGPNMAITVELGN